MLDYDKAVAATSKRIVKLMEKGADEDSIISHSEIVVGVLSEIYSVHYKKIVKDLANNLSDALKNLAIHAPSETTLVPCKVESYTNLKRAKMLFENNAFTITNFIPSEENSAYLLSMLLECHAIPSDEPARIYFTTGDYLNSLSDKNLFDEDCVIASVMCSHDVEYLPGLIEAKNTIEKMDDECFWYNEIVSPECLEATQ